MYGLSHSNKGPPSTNVFPINWRKRRMESRSERRKSYIYRHSQQKKNTPVFNAKLGIIKKKKKFHRQLKLTSTEWNEIIFFIFLPLKLTELAQFHRLITMEPNRKESVNTGCCKVSDQSINQSIKKIYLHNLTKPPLKLPISAEFIKAIKEPN